MPIDIALHLPEFRTHAGIEIVFCMHDRLVGNDTRRAHSVHDLTNLFCRSVGKLIRRVSGLLGCDPLSFDFTKQRGVALNQFVTRTRRRGKRGGNQWIGVSWKRERVVSRICFGCLQADVPCGQHRMFVTFCDPQKLLPAANKRRQQVAGRDDLIKTFFRIFFEFKLGA